MSEIFSLPESYKYLNRYTSPVKPMERTLVGRESEIRSILASLCRPELSNVLLLGDAGSGKALADDTLIPVADNRGYVCIGDIVVGDKVFDESGNPCEVTGVFHQGYKHAYKVTFKDGASIVCNDEHLWFARTRSQHHDNRDYSVHSLRDMIDYGIVRGKSNDLCWYVPQSKAVVRDEYNYGVDPYVIGALIGDGCLTINPLTISSNDEWVVNKVANHLGAVGYKKWTSKNYSWIFYSQNPRARQMYIQLSDIESKEDLSSIIDKKSGEKRIPRQYFLGSIDQRKELLRGLMDTDGCISCGYRCNMSFSTTSAGLAEDIQELASSLGMSTSLSVMDRSNKNSIEYEVYFRVSPDRVTDLFSLPRKVNYAKNYHTYTRKYVRRYDDIAIQAVDDLGEDVMMTCITVNSSNRVYLAGKEHIVTHNTAIVQGCMMRDKDRLYLEVDLAKMIADVKTDVNELASMLKALFDEVITYRKSDDEDREIVLFIDEFHQIVQLSAAAVEALKPLLADSGTRGVRVIVATTYKEFRKYISNNQPLVERLHRLNVSEPSKETTIEILKGMAERYGIANHFYDDHIFELIYEYTNRYIPANSQPRKSILILDAMCGWHKAEGRPFDKKLLADVIYESEGVNVSFRVDANSIKRSLDEEVLAQQFATKVIEQRLQICVADLNDKTRPMSTLLFCGATGVGKTQLAKSLAKILFESEEALVRFDMSEYSQDESMERFRDELTARVWAKPYSIILLDEIEKACGAVTRLLLQVLDDARLLDKDNKEISFKNSYIIMTTNAGSEIFKTIGQYNVDDLGSGKEMQKYDKLIRASIIGTTGGNKFPPELLGRVDAIVPFQPLSENTMAEILKKKLRKFQEEVLIKHNVSLQIKSDVVKYLIYDTLDQDTDSGGARAVISKMNSEVISAVAAFINKYPDIKRIGVTINGEMAVDNKNKLLSEAYVQVVSLGN